MPSPWLSRFKGSHRVCVEIAVEEARGFWSQALHASFGFSFDVAERQQLKLQGAWKSDYRKHSVDKRKHCPSLGAIGKPGLLFLDPCVLTLPAAKNHSSSSLFQYP